MENGELVSWPAKTVGGDQGSFWPKPEDLNTAVRHFSYRLAEEPGVLTLCLSFCCCLMHTSPENGWNASLVPWKRNSEGDTWKRKDHVMGIYYVPGHCAIIFLDLHNNPL